MSCHQLIGTVTKQKSMEVLNLWKNHNPRLEELSLPGRTLCCKDVLMTLGSIFQTAQNFPHCLLYGTSHRWTWDDWCFLELLQDSYLVLPLQGPSQVLWRKENSMNNLSSLEKHSHWPIVPIDNKCSFEGLQRWPVFKNVHQQHERMVSKWPTRSVEQDHPPCARSSWC